MSKLLSRVNNEDAARRLDGFPYSIIENVWHADFWQQIWLEGCEGGSRPSIIGDWQSPSADEWPDVRKSFLSNQDRAIEIAEAGAPKAQSQEKAAVWLTRLALHNAYHVGQVKLIKRVMRELG